MWKLGKEAGQTGLMRTGSIFGCNVSKAYTPLRRISIHCIDYEHGK